MKTLRLLVFFALFAQICVANPSDFEQGNLFYSHKDYEKAITAYEKHIVLYPFDYAAYFNLGNSYYQTKNYASALWAYEKTVLIQPNFKDAEHNAKLAFDKTKQVGRWQNATFWAFRSLFSVGINFWAFCSVILALILFTGTFFYFKTVTLYYRKLLLVGNLSLFLLLVVTLTLAGLHYKRLNDHTMGIIITPSVHAKIAPDTNEKTSFDLPAGKKVYILQNQEDWY